MVVNSCKYGGMAVLVGCLLWTGGMAQAVDDFEKLSLEIATGKRDVLPIEPIPITITLSNNTARPITGHTMIDPGFGFVDIYVARGNRPFEEFRSSDWPTATGIVGDVVLKPGFRRSVSGYLFYAHPANLDKEKHGQYLFESSGTYRIKATFENLKGESKIESNILTIEAKQPTGQDAAAYEFLKSIRKEQDKDVYYGNFLLADFGRQKVLDKQEECISRFPTSRYSRYLYYSLGLTYRRRDNEKDVQKGITLLEKAAGYDDFFLAKEALLKLIETLSEQGETKKAWKYKKIFARRFPDSEEGRDHVEEVYIATVERRRLVWPLLIVGIAAVVFLFGLRLLLKKRASSRGKSRAT